MKTKTIRIWDDGINQDYIDIGGNRRSVTSRIDVYHAWDLGTKSIGFYVTPKQLERIHAVIGDRLAELAAAGHIEAERSEKP